ncbi:MAG: helix-turn-helix transcriptional regulator [Candidatus Flexifilum sp.]|jgi:predicted ArsR family transcriptional regulator
MQETRRIILEILRQYGQATVEDIVSELERRRGNITSVTVRHHLNRLQREGLISSPQQRRRAAPGRPQHVYTLTEKARRETPGNYQRLSLSLLNEIKQALPPDGVNVIIEGVATTLASDLVIPPEMTFEERLSLVSDYLSQQGYAAHWETHPDGYILYTANCPYHHIVDANRQLCDLDMRLVSLLLGVVPRRLHHWVEDGQTCSYLLPHAAVEQNLRNDERKCDIA